ncbi:MAG: hypothetical protein OET55_09070, partial [Desulfuromonadales bacterium]|nr:hypothetical protein [Desulfuromonadales bacterium]
MKDKISTLVVALVFLSVSFVLSSCGGGGGGGSDDSATPSPTDSYLLFYGDNSIPDTSGDGL